MKKNTFNLYIAITIIIAVSVFTSRGAELRHLSKVKFQFLVFDTAAMSKEHNMPACSLRYLAKSVQTTDSISTITEYLKSINRACSYSESICLVKVRFSNTDTCAGEILAIEYGDIKDL